MAIIQPQIIVPENIYRDYLLGNVEIKGLAKDSDNGQIVKHLDTIDSNDYSNAMHVAVAVSAIVVVTAIVAGVTVRLVGKANQKKVEHFKECLNAYITAANEQTLNTKVIDDLITAMDKLKRSTRKKVVIEFSTEELSNLIDCLCNHTQTLSQANHIECACDYTDEERADVLLKLRNNLIVQKGILCEVA